jgi:signal transduction histidine kinase
MAMTIRGKILLAFCALAAITGLLGLFGVQSVVESGRLVVDTYDRPLMSISYARLALADFRAMELAFAQYQQSGDATRRHALEMQLAELGRSLADALSVAEQRASSQRAVDAAHEASRAFAVWDELRQSLSSAPDPHERGTFEERAAAIVDSLDNLVELTAEDGFRDRERAIASIARYREISIVATVAALLLGCAVAVLLVRRMVRPIAAASRAASRIADGELDVEIGPTGTDELGRLLAAMTMMRDNIRHMMEREIAARRSAQARLVDAIESSDEGVVLIDGEGRILVTNSQARSFFPALTAELGAGERLPSSLQLLLTEPSGEMRLEDGRWLHLGRSATEDGGFVIIASDITALKEREAALQTAMQRSEAANRAKTEFLANMSHELRTPLNAVIGFSEIIAGEMFGPIGTPRYKVFAGDILRSGRHLLEVINDILDIAKLQSGKTELTLRPVSLAGIIDDSVRIIREQAESAGIALTVRIENELPLVDGDATRLRQVLLNLLSNAIKFTPAGGRVLVTADRGDEAVLLAVSDTGIGMAPEDIPKALEPFGQIESSTTRKYGGTGLGLPISKMFAEQHGGRLQIESTPGRGTTVTVQLPISAEQLPTLAMAI